MLPLGQAPRCPWAPPHNTALRLSVSVSVRVSVSVSVRASNGALRLPVRKK